MKTWLTKADVEDLNVLHRSLSSTALNTFQMNCNQNHLTQHQFLILLMLLWLKEQIPIATFQTLVESLPTIVKVISTANKD